MGQEILFPAPIHLGKCIMPSFRVEASITEDHKLSISIPKELGLVPGTVKILLFCPPSSDVAFMKKTLKDEEIKQFLELRGVGDLLNVVLEARRNEEWYLIILPQENGLEEITPQE